MIGQIISPISPTAVETPGSPPFASLPTLEQAKRSNSIIDMRFVHPGFELVGAAIAPKRASFNFNNLILSQDEIYTSNQLRSAPMPSTNTVNPVSTAIIRELDTLAAGKEDESRPTSVAYANARSTVEAAYGRTKSDKNLPVASPIPFVTTDDLGGIRILWHTDTKRLRANFGAADNLRSYLYYSTDVDHNVEPLDENHLAERLAWLADK